MMNKINFPDQDYFLDLFSRQEKKVQNSQTETERVLMLAGASLNWLGDFFTDPNVQWAKEELQIDSLTLTGVNPNINDIIINKANRSPIELKKLLHDDKVKEQFEDFEFSDKPILVRADEKILKVLDGMHRVIAAIRDSKVSVKAWVARIAVTPAPMCEPHVVYDLLRAYQRKINTDKVGLEQALRFLRKSYANVADLLQNRFNEQWLPDAEIQKIIQNSLKD